MENREHLFSPYTQRIVRPLLSALLAFNIVSALPDTAQAHTQSENDSTAHGEYNFSIQPGQCGARLIPSWVVNGVKEYQCLTLAGEPYEVRIDTPTSRTVTVNISSKSVPTLFASSLDLVQSSMTIPKGRVTIVPSFFDDRKLAIDTTTAIPHLRQIP